ncbi:hypothetical protein KC952_01780 [Candidatus Saccharibacteria bacterium]|nr:hypothetical protein [Candidatus Saccharibacteria bacterium]
MSKIEVRRTVEAQPNAALIRYIRKFLKPGSDPTRFYLPGDMDPDLHDKLSRDLEAMSLANKEHGYTRVTNPVCPNSARIELCEESDVVKLNIVVAIGGAGLAGMLERYKVGNSPDNNLPRLVGTKLVVPLSAELKGLYSESVKPIQDLAKEINMQALNKKPGYTPGTHSYTGIMHRSVATLPSE